MMIRIRSTPPGVVARRFALAIFVLGVGGVGACGALVTAKAQFENSDQPFFLHALSGSQIPYTTALDLGARSVTRVDGSFAFDLAFDFDAQGNVVVLPASVVGQNPAGNRRVGVLKPGGTYDNVTEAPRNGFVYDSVTVIRKGEPAVVQARESQCGFSLAPFLHAKIVIDSTDVAARVMWGRTTINLNCGFRSLKAGLPTF